MESEEEEEKIATAFFCLPLLTARRLSPSASRPPLPPSLPPSLPPPSPSYSPVIALRQHECVEALGVIFPQLLGCGQVVRRQGEDGGLAQTFPVGA